MTDSMNINENQINYENEGFYAEFNPEHKSFKIGAGGESAKNLSLAILTLCSAAVLYASTGKIKIPTKEIIKELLP